MDSFVFSTTGQIFFRPGASTEIGSLLGGRVGGQVLVITDPGLRKLGLCEPALNSLQSAGIAVTVFDRVEPDPSLSTAMSAVELGREKAITGVIGFGGGSSLDVAKLVALICGSNEEIEEAWGVGNAKGPTSPSAGADDGWNRIRGHPRFNHHRQW